MKKICFIAAVTLFISWISLFFIFQVGNFIHILILLAILLGLHGIITVDPKKVRINNKL